MDKKDLEAISQIVNSAIESSNEKLRQEMRQSNKELNEKMRQLDEELSEKMRLLSEKVEKEMDAFEKKMLDRMFVFEQDYGEKIDAIFDVVVMQKDKAQEMYKNQEKFGIQVDNLDTKVFGLEQRVFKLEHS